MAIIGEIKEVNTVDGQIVVIFDTGSGPALTATVMQSGASEFHPMVGDTVVAHRAGQEIAVSAVFAEDTTTSKGECLLFSRNASGTVVATVLLGADGKIVFTPLTTAEVGNGSDFVAMATKADTLWSTLWTVFNTWVPVAQDGGAALKTAFLAAFPPPGPSSVASTNLKAD